jgi:hypothetical protein
MLSLISMYYKPLGIMLVSMALIAYIGFLRAEKNNAIKDRDIYKQQNIALTQQAVDWQNLVKEQNSKIDNMNRAYDEMTKRVEGARTTIQHMNVEAQVKLEALKHYYESIPDSNTCDAIKRILDADIPLVH